MWYVRVFEVESLQLRILIDVLDLVVVSPLFGVFKTTTMIHLDHDGPSQFQVDFIKDEMSLKNPQRGVEAAQVLLEVNDCIDEHDIACLLD